ncbi:hypothetical protein HRbin05_00475 [archaeon HR05]|uniref:Uncharacterized protein n=1 Tax=Candidatus Nitrosocaldus cavascurensis TaxID=2058097 RepID=A0A2K5ATC1_9ARCH|nr:hypothetical protein HRbin05_00475 [archaeon HR05]SPC34854.1 protein of unknown function [Candidatus Nitrosocaldus cavascurensis]
MFYGYSLDSQHYHIADSYLVINSSDSYTTLVIEPDYIDDMEIYKHLSVTADNYYIDIPASKGDNILHTVQLRVSASNDARGSLYIQSRGCKLGW